MPPRARLELAPIFCCSLANHTPHMDILEPSLPSTGIAALQKQIREYVSLLTLIKKKREEVKTLNASLKALSDDILENMTQQNVPSCVSMGYTFSVKEKTKMKSATAKTFLAQVKEYFNISDIVMANFEKQVEERRRAEAELVTTLECKSQQKRAPKNSAATEGSLDDSNTDAPSLSNTIDEMYS